MNGLGKDYIWSELSAHFNAAFLRKIKHIAHAITDLYCNPNHPVYGSHERKCRLKDNFSLGQKVVLYPVYTVLAGRFNCCSEAREQECLSSSVTWKWWNGSTCQPGSRNALLSCGEREREREDDNLKRLGGEDFITGRGGDGVAILLQIKLSGSRRKFYAKARHDMRRAS